MGVTEYKHQGEPNCLCLRLQLSAQVMGEARRLGGWEKKAETDHREQRQGRLQPLWQGFVSAATLPEMYIQNQKLSCYVYFSVMSSEREQGWLWKKSSDKFTVSHIS